MHRRRAEIASAAEEIVQSCETMIQYVRFLERASAAEPEQYAKIRSAMHRLMDHSSRVDLEIGALMILLQ